MITENTGFTTLTPLFRGVSVVFSLVLVSICYQIYQINAVQQSWPVIQGTVITTSSKGWWDEAAKRRYYLRYSYTVNGQEYTSSRFHIKENSIKRYKYLLNGYSKGDAIPVHYNPSAPEEAVINSDLLRNGFLIALVLGGFIVMAATMIIKESGWRRQTDKMRKALGNDYQGETPLPATALVRDGGRSGSSLRINTGMSIFWSTGIPFVLVAFLCVAAFLPFTDEINPGWTISSYFTFIGAGYLLCSLAALVIHFGFRHSLEFRSSEKIILDNSVRFFKKQTRQYQFSDISEARLYRKQWRHDNPLKNWIFYLQTHAKKSLFICFRHRDVLPASYDYLHFIEMRLRHLLRKARD